LVHSTEKSIKEHGDKVDPTTIEAIELSIKALQETLSSDDPDKIRARSQDVTEAAMKLGEAIYKSEAENNPETGDAPENSSDNDDDVFDADFEDLTDEKK
jgi:molecular chaperone DnaK